MTTIFVSHRSALVAYLVAAALKLHYRHRTLRIVIVELFDKSTPTDNSPYCGASTVSNLRLSRWPFLQSALLIQVLSLVVTFAESIHLHERGPQMLSPELPVWAQKRKVVAGIGNPDRFVGVFYLPQRVEQALVAFLTENHTVSFMSVQSHHSLASVIRNMSRSSADVSADVWLHLGREDINNRTANINQIANLDILASSTMCGLEVAGGQNRALNHEVFLFNQGVQGFPSPSTVLWLPLFKSAAHMFNEPIFHQQMHFDRNFVNVSVAPINLNVHEETFLSRHDLFYGLKMCSYVLDAIDNMFGRYNFDLTAHRL